LRRATERDSPESRSSGSPRTVSQTGHPPRGPSPPSAACEIVLAQRGKPSTWTWPASTTWHLLLAQYSFGCPRKDGAPSIPPCVGGAASLAQATSGRPASPPGGQGIRTGMGEEVANSPSATCLEARGELNTSGVVISSRRLVGTGRKGTSPPYRGSSPVSIGSGPCPGRLPPGDDPGDRGSGDAEGDAVACGPERPPRRRIGLPGAIGSGNPRGGGGCRIGWEAVRERSRTAGVAAPPFAHPSPRAFPRPSRHSSPSAFPRPSRHSSPRPREGKGGESRASIACARSLEW
jgi:hypothetical protein